MNTDELIHLPSKAAVGKGREGIEGKDFTIKNKWGMGYFGGLNNCMWLVC